MDYKAEARRVQNCFSEEFMSKNTLSVLGAFCFGLVLLDSGISGASEAVSQYYYSQAARITHLPSRQVTTEEVLLVRTLDLANSLISEIACIKSPGRPAYMSPVYMKVTGNTLQIADTPDVSQPNKIRGTGEVWGPDWNWNYLKFSMVYIPYSTAVEDENFVTSTQLIAKKQLLGPNGIPFEYYDLEADLITQREYQSRYTEIGCPSLTQN